MSAVPIEAAAPPREALASPQLRTLALCDLVDSTALTEQLGDQRAAELVRRLDRITRDLLHRHGGREIDKTDGFLILFERPIQATAFALDYQRQLRELGQAEFLPLKARIGIHVGDVMLWQNEPHDVAQGAKPLEVEGLIKPVAARLMNLALPGQILLSGVAYTLAHRAQGELDPERTPAQWKAHGNYRFKGLIEHVPVYEVGEPGIAPLRAPPWSSKAHREVPWWRRPGIVAIEAAVVIAAVALPLYFSLRSPPAIAFAKRDWVVVADLRNLTGQGVFDNSLDAAFRIGLEQSRYVNVLSDLQVRDTLKRMQRDPDKTAVDRAIGSEIAMREGARALILPSIAEIGGHVRVTAEVIDPHTQTTVYSESADGVGAESALPSLDRIDQKLRLRLGEALATVTQDSAPLPQVTTPNLDALRAYALNLRAYREGRWSEALALLDQALKFDPDFALAYIGKAAVHLSANDNISARADLQRAQALRAHLTPREVLRLDAKIAMLEKPAAALEKLKLYSSVYPDAYVAYYDYALIAWTHLNQYDSAIAELNKGLTEHNPSLGAFYYFLGTLQVASERFDDAVASFKRAQALQGSHLNLMFVAAYAARRQFDAAEKTFQASQPTGVASNDIGQKLTAITLAADKGNWPQALADAQSGVDAADRAGPLHGRLFRATQLSLLALSSSQDTASRLRGFIETETAILKRENDVDHPTAVFHVLFAAYLAARIGETELARTAIVAARGAARDSGYPNLVHMLAVAEAERARAGGAPAEAIALLTHDSRGDELFLDHVALRDAYLAADKSRDALRESLWLTQHRGRAYEEYNDNQALQPLNVVESDLAVLNLAEINAHIGNAAESAKALREFLALWPEAKQLGFVSARLDKLKQTLARDQLR